MNGLKYPAKNVFEDKGTVLVVDDATLNLDFISEILTRDGFEVLQAKSGRVALETVLAHKPDLILLDIVMPEMDGYEVCRRLKEDKWTRDVPVIFIGTIEDGAERVQPFEVGGVDCISKPFRSEDLLARVRTHVALRKVQTRLEKQKAKLEQEIAERKKAERALRESDERLQSILDSSQACIYIKDTQGRYRLVNRTFEKLFHVERDSFIGKTDYDICSWEMAEAFHRNDLEVLKLGRSIQVEEEAYHDDGLHSYLSLKFPLFSTKGKIYAVCGISSDITIRKQAELLLQQAKESAESANRAKSIFLANMSHELRTPLNVIHGFSQLMQRDSSLSNSSKKHLEAINRSGEHLLSLINDVLEVSKIEIGCLSLSQGVFDLYSLLEDLNSMFKMRADQKRLCFNIEKQDALPQFLVGDEGKLRQVLINLIGNAIKFTDVGDVTLRVFVDSDRSPIVEKGDKRQWTLSFEVEDSGIGIIPQEMDKLFQPFEQTMSGKSKGGTGLGLTISREYMRLMGGDLAARSIFGNGSVFTASCRFEEGQKEFVKRVVEVRRVLGLTPDSGPKTILVVDDKEKNRRFVVELLTVVGFKTLEAANGEEALAVCMGGKPDLVLMDMRLPVMDGYEATRRLKATELGKNIPVIAVSASAFEEERNEILATGADEFISKPFRESELFAGIKKLLEIEYRYAEDSAPLPDPEGSATLTPKDLEFLPDELREELRQALVILHVDAIRDVIGRISSFDRPLGKVMERMEKQYQFEVLLNLLKK